MIVARTVEEIRAAVQQLRRNRPNSTVGFVPTMGYLHEGHASLMRKSVEQNEISVLSIFVNPIQFGPNEDLERYPRNESGDLQLAGQCGIDIVFLPSVDVMYPQATKTKIRVAEVTEGLCGASRPGHFDGVTTVVAKLFNMVKPDRAYFGLKDAQQVAVIQQMVNDLNIDVQIVPCPIVREADGLALSSRNVYLSDEERRQALVLSESLQMAHSLIREQSTITAAELNDVIVKYIQAMPIANIDYVEIVQYPSMERFAASVQLAKHNSDILIALAVRFGNTRLIDNLYLPYQS
ncbi:pantoate--beta-alanine ligase [Paenibacillus sp. SC116]|uniref:pantoate--beta-alanine ligase n=1 Tax=Paenibacillus sp. SC116 TaxID=2968986 RepID=UPI00215B115C|nr:pantoate--beta-alanine ligase [Paenibacillus sp. SC116]MCR8842928.1 pantoate--beta-alanine ligase [Paenibacillus sp. SC116]